MSTPTNPLRGPGKGTTCPDLFLLVAGQDLGRDAASPAILRDFIVPRSAGSGG